MDGVRKDMQAVKEKIKTLVDKRGTIKNEIAKLEDEVKAATASREEAYKNIWALRNQRDKEVCSFTLHSNIESLTQKIGMLIFFESLCGNSLSSSDKEMVETVAEEDGDQWGHRTLLGFVFF